MKLTNHTTGIIHYTKYEENVIIDNSFDTAELYNIMDNDKDFVKFETFIDGVLISVDYSKRIHGYIADLKDAIRLNDWMGRGLIEAKLSELLKKPTPHTLTKDAKVSYWGPFDDDAYLNRTGLKG